MGILFKNGTVVTASDMFQADVLVEDEIISLVGKNIAPDGQGVAGAPPPDRPSSVCKA